jgi:hypothetical protein
MQLCPGFGPTKVRRLREAFNKPFYSTGQKPLNVQNSGATMDVASEIVQGTDPREGKNIDENHHAQYTSSDIPPLLPRTARHSSPEWDIEVTQTEGRLDVNLDLSLELNPSDEEAWTMDGNELVGCQWGFLQGVQHKHLITTVTWFGMSS